MGENLSGKSLQGLRGGSAAGGPGFVLLAAALWALITPISRILLAADVHPVEMAVWRGSVAWLLFVAHVAIGPRRPGAGARWRVDTRDLPGLAAFGVIGIAALYVALPLAVREGGAALASVLLYTAPAWVAVMSWLVLGERPGRMRLTAVALTLGGIVAIAASGGGTIRAGAAAIAWGLAAGLSYASLFIFGKRFFAKYEPATVFLYALPVAVLSLLPFAQLSRPGGTTLLLLLATGILSTYGAYLAYSAGLVRLEATRVATIATAEPVIASSIAFALFGETFGVVGYAGAAAVIAGVIVASRE
jgi:drug/metabolite transporter, DME family